MAPPRRPFGRLHFQATEQTSADLEDGEDDGGEDVRNRMEKEQQQKKKKKKRKDALVEQHRLELSHTPLNRPPQTRPEGSAVEEKIFI